MARQTDGQTGRWADGQTDEYTGKQRNKHKPKVIKNKAEGKKQHFLRRRAEF